MISLFCTRKFSTSMIRVSHDFTVLKTFQSAESPVLLILPKIFSTRLRRVFFQILSSQMHGNTVGYRNQLNSMVNTSAVYTVNSQRTKCAVASWIRRHSCLKTLLWVRISRNRCELWYSNLNLAKFDAESSSKTVFVYIRPSNEPVNVLFWPRWFQCFLFWEKSWKRWFQWAMIRVFQKLSAPIDDFDDFSEPWFQCAMTVLHTGSFIREIYTCGDWCGQRKNVTSIS